LALDIVLIKDKDGNGTFETASWEDTVDFDKDGKADWMEIVKIFKANGWTWGGDWKTFKDKPHFEKTFGHTWRSLLAKHNARDFISGTNYVKI
jgi:peptidoglycan L-alanyl-D-glutamate endopeptidase CwlK